MPIDRRLGPVWLALLAGFFFVVSARADGRHVPQFALAAADGHAAHDHADTRMLLAKLIKPMGFLTLSLVAVTVALGVLRRRWQPRLMLKIHKTCGVSVLVAGAVHAALVAFLH